ncbi:hypothetical protein N7G274_003823 [Stereocaulon virgatum]|uniref:NACHT domain-containing protein n=1 Tax=Stereocaulon virgatum TaxID=373712 RepID=A0ABR4AF85_9LECA
MDVRPTFKERTDSFHAELKKFAGVFVIVDALDEVSEYGDIRSIFTELLLLPVRLFVTSCHDPMIEKIFSAAIRHETRASEEDVRSYIHGRLLLEPLLKSHVAADPTLEDTMSTKILKSARGIRIPDDTLQEYLKKNQTILFPDAQTLIATACLTYLFLAAFSHDPEPGYATWRTRSLIPPTFSTLYEDHRLVNYATRYWGAHTHAESEEAATNVAVNFLSEKANVAHAWCILFKEAAYWKKKPISFTGDYEIEIRALKQPLYGMLLALRFGLKVIFEEILSSSTLSSELLFKHGWVASAARRQNLGDKRFLNSWLDRTWTGRLKLCW